MLIHFLGGSQIVIFLCILCKLICLGLGCDSNSFPPKVFIFVAYMYKEADVSEVNDSNCAVQ